MKLKIILLASIVAVGSMAYSQKSKKEESWEKLDAFVESKEFRIESTWARPQASTSVNAIAGSNLQPTGSAGNRFNLIGNFNFLEMEGDSVAAYLPYYGELQAGSSHYPSGNTAIEFKGIPRNLTIEKNEKKKKYEVKFDVDRDTETFQIHIDLYTSLKSQITVNSNQRFVIRYDGDVKRLPANEEAEGK